VDDWSRRSQPDLLEWVLPSPSNCVQDPGTRLAPRCCCDGALPSEATLARRASPTSQMGNPPRGLGAVAGFHAHAMRGVLKLTEALGGSLR
jgi:hypothetical protein